MPIPNFRSIILLLLKMAGDQNEHHRRIVVDVLVSHFSLTDNAWILIIFQKTPMILKILATKK